MSPKAVALMNLYKRHVINVEGLRRAFLDGVITEDEFNYILNYS